MGTHQEASAQASRGGLRVQGHPYRLDEQLRRTYEDGNHVNLRAVIAANGLEGQDDGIADLIDADARIRIQRSMPVDLDRYLNGIPGLVKLPAALDTAIEMTLRSMSGSGRPDAAGVAALSQKYPHLAGAIATATALSDVLVSTEQLRRTITVGNRTLPEDFGPVLRDGRRRYELRELLGAGSHGAVYLAFDRQLSDRDRPAWVAIKILNAVHNSEEDQARLADEATKARRIDDPAVIRVLDLGEAGGEQYLIYEYVKGGDLQSYIAARGGRVSPQEAATIVMKIARGLQAAHAAGLAHCDLKPANVLMNEEGQPKVSDFGIAVRLREGAIGGSYPRMGNLAFIAPEQFREEPGAASPLADVYAAGGLLYWLLSGQYPNGDSAEEVSRRFTEDGRDARLGQGALRQLDPDLQAILARALHLQRRERYQSAEALARDLEGWLRYEPLSWRRQGVRRQAILLMKREPWAVATGLVAMGLVVVAAGVTVYIQQSGRREVIEAELQRVRLVNAEQANTFRMVELQTDAMLRVLQTRRVSEDFLPMLTAMESLNGPVLLDSKQDHGKFFSARVEIVKPILDKAKAEGREDHIESMLWESVYGFWLLRLENLEEAREVLERNRERWERIVPQDPWIASIDGMLACVTAMESLKAPEAERRDALIAAAAALDVAVEMAVERPVGRFMQRQLLSTQVDVYGPEGLNDTRRHKQARDRLKKVE